MVDAVGYCASALVLLTFYMKSMVPLRIAALCSNFAFVIYGWELTLMPVLLLHLGLAPLNAVRLWQACADQTSNVLAPTTAEGSAKTAAKFARN
jgi:hypothetical protein